MLHETTTAGDSPGIDVAAFVKYNDLPFVLPPFSLIRDFGQQNTCGNVSKFLLKPGFHIVVSVVSVVRKKFIGQIEFILSHTKSICRFFCIEHLYGRFP